jgi:ATP-dependent Clp protease ATP-binding subunit ClpC
MYERFTKEACQVLVLAQEETRRLGRTRIGTEQMLLALIGEGSGVASLVLNRLGVNLTSARLKVEQITGLGTGVTPWEEVCKFSPRAERVVVLSGEEALQLGYNFIGTEHLLLALIQEEDSVALRVLKSLGVEPEQVRTQIHIALNE